MSASDLQSFFGPDGDIRYLYKGKFIFCRDYRRGEIVFIRCQEQRRCLAKGQLLDDPNSPSLEPQLLKIDEHHTHGAQVHN
jgi:hypothetical protein